jgi:hypothetical protein
MIEVQMNPRILLLALGGALISAASPAALGWAGAACQALALGVLFLGIHTICGARFAQNDMLGSIYADLDNTAQHFRSNPTLRA